MARCIRAMSWPAGRPQHRHELSKFQGKAFPDGYPEITSFAKKILAPGSTK